MEAKIPVDSVDAHDEGLYIVVGGAAEFAARLRTEGRPVTECETVQRTDGRAVGHHCSNTDVHTLFTLVHIYLIMAITPDL